MSHSVNIHRVTSVTVERRVHWLDKPDLTFNVMLLRFKSEDGDFELNVYSKEPIVLDNPKVEVCD